MNRSESLKQQIQKDRMIVNAMKQLITKGASIKTARTEARNVVNKQWRTHE